MKHCVTFLTALLLLAGSAFAQYEPTSTWPYIYQDFTSGEIQMNVGNPQKGRFNIHVSKGRLHFIDGDYICEARMQDVLSVQIGNDFYTNVGGTMMKVLSKTALSLVVEEMLVDNVRLNATGGAYGSSSSTLSTTALSAVEQTTVGGRTEFTRLASTKEDGQLLPLMKKKYVVTKGRIIYVSRKDVLEAFPERKEEISLFAKKNKVKWNDPLSVQRLVDYLIENKTE